MPGRPSPPDWLGDDARREWARIVPLLEARGLLTLEARAALAGYCTAWGELAAAQRAILADGATVQGDDGVPRLSPQLRRAEKARADLVRFSREFGITPASAASVRAGPSEKDQAAAARRARFAILGARAPATS